MKIEVMVEVPEQNIVNCLDNADIGYWVKSVTGCTSHEDLLAGKTTATVVEDEPQGDTDTHVLTGDKVRAALPIIAKRWPWHLKDIMADNTDATTGDVLVQVALFSEIIYG